MDPKSLEIDSNRYFEMYPFTKHKEGWEIPTIPTIATKGIHKHLEDIKNLETRKDDIILCSSMKSGTHWMHEIISMLLNNTTDYNSFGPWWEMNLEFMRQPDKVQQITKPRILSTHLPYRFLPKTHIENGYKIVYLNRNPKDRYVSLRYFWDGKPSLPNWTWDEYFEDQIMNDKVYTGWFNYTKEMTDVAKNKPESIFSVTYEALLLDTKASYTKLAKFLSVPYTDEFIDDVIKKCSFKNLKENKLDASMLVEEGVREKQSIFRKGVIGDWKNYFTVAQNERYDSLYAKEMKSVDAEFIYEQP